MNEKRPENNGERDLLRRFSRAVRQAAGPCPGELALAAYVDGLASESDGERIETHLAACPSCLDAVVEARQLATAAAAQAPARVAARAEALVTARRALGLPRTWRRAASWAAAAAAAVAVGFGGLRAGSALRDRGQTAAWLASEVAFDPPAQCRDLLSPTDVLGALASQAQEDGHE